MEALARELARPAWRLDLDVTRDRSGRVTALTAHMERAPKKRSSPLAGPGERVLVATIHAEDRRLTVETNSRERDAAVAARLAKLEPEILTYLETQTKSYEAMEREPRNIEAVRREEEAERQLMERPEVRALLEERIRRYSVSWCDQAIPALGRRRPRKLIESPAGRRRVLALLESFEAGPNSATGTRSFDTDLVRRELGLPSRAP